MLIDFILKIEFYMSRNANDGFALKIKKNPANKRRSKNDQTVNQNLSIGIFYIFLPR